MSFVRQIDRTQSPEKMVFRDCGRIISRARSLVPQLEQRTVSAEQLRRLLRDLHSVKGAAAFLNRRGLSENLHRLESLLCACLGPAEQSDLSEIGEIFQNLGQHLEGSIGGIEPVGSHERVHRVGESLWWSHELTQSTAVRLGKRVFVIVRGGELAIGNHVHLALQSCLVHLVRNAIVHGIELPAVRRDAGKSEIGLITVKAERRDGVLTISMGDNGSGLEPGSCDGDVDVARDAGTKITMDAGRGVGLATVRELIEESGGDLEISSIPGEGSTFTMVFPDI
jgi:chemotaxis protein histidine kinase CheA